MSVATLSAADLCALSMMRLENSGLSEPAVVQAACCLEKQGANSNVSS